QVSALASSETSSVAGGRLYLTDLVENGGNPQRPEPGPAIRGRAAGAVVVNPAYALLTGPQTPQQRQSLRFGLVPDGGMIEQDRALTLRLLQPSRALARGIERRIDQRFSDSGVAAAQDEGQVRFRTMPQYGD